MMLVHMSVSGGILILFIIVLRLLAIHKFLKRFFVLLWSIALLRLLLPLDLPISYGVAVPAANVVNQGISEISDISWSIVLWFSVMIVLFIIFGVFYYQEYRQLREAIPISEEEKERLKNLASVPKSIKIMVSDRVFTPLTFGVFIPKIVLPKVLAEHTDVVWKYVLMHEMVHIKRRDNFLKIVMLIAAAIHWFNPLVWIMCILLNRDIELSCDEKVISLLGENRRKQYAMTLVHLAEQQHQRSLFSYGFGKNPIKERIEAIMRYKKTTRISVICAAVILGAAVTVFGQNPSEMAVDVQVPVVKEKKDAGTTNEINAGYREPASESNEGTVFEEDKGEVNAGNDSMRVTKE